MEQPIEYPIDEILVMSTCVESIKKLKEFGYSFEFIINLTVKAFNSDKNVSCKIKENNDLLLNKSNSIEKIDKSEKDLTNKSSPPPSQEDNIQKKEKEEQDQKKKSSCVPIKKYYTKNPIRLYSEEEEISSIEDNNKYQHDVITESKSKHDVKHEIEPEVKPEVYPDAIIESKRPPLICARCENEGHVERFCRINLNIQCERCLKYGHHVSRCQISCGICNRFGHNEKQCGKYCNHCKRYNHSDDQCWKKEK